jgi:hypothetical protein
MLVRHRQTKGAETDRHNLTPPRHISTLHVWCGDPKNGLVAKTFRLQEANRNRFLRRKNTELSWSALLYEKPVYRRCIRKHLSTCE